LNYTKQEITVVDDALAAVQSTAKPLCVSDGIPDSTQPSDTCYESDE
jgi:hypothetical protein